MRTSFTALGAFLLACCLTSLVWGETGVQWQTDLETAKRMAAASNRLVLIHFSGNWCKPCQHLESQVFNKDSVGRAIDANYVPVKLSVEQQPALARQYGVRAVPWDVIITSDGQVVRDFISPQGEHAYVGAMTEIATRYRPQPTTLLAAGPAVPTATPVGYGVPPAGQSASVPTNHVPQQQASQPQQVAPQAGRWSDNRYADYSQQRQQPVADPVSPPIANQVNGSNFGAGPAGAPPLGPSFGSPGTNSQFGAPPIYQAPGVGAAGNGFPPSSYPVDTRYPSQQAQGNTSTNMPSSNLQPGMTLPPPYNPASSGFNPPPPYSNPPLGTPTGAFAIDGYCPVHLMESGNWTKGDEKWGAIHRGKTYLFVTEQCQQRFMANPDRYAPAFDGNDPVHLVDRNQTVPGRREIGCYFGVEPNRRIVLFADETSYQTFSRNPQRYAQQIFARQ
jgi:YHS domain-containing protein